MAHICNWSVNCYLAAAMKAVFEVAEHLLVGMTMRMGLYVVEHRRLQRSLIAVILMKLMKSTMRVELEANH